MPPDQPITTVEMHTAGEPVRIVTSGYPPLRGRHHPGKAPLRQGSSGSSATDADGRAARACRHVRGTPGRARPARRASGRALPAQRGLFDHVRPRGDRARPLRRRARAGRRRCEPETEVRIQCPCGLVTTTVEVADGRAGRVRFASVPAFAFARDAVVVSGPFGPVTLDIGYGGAFYGVLPASALGLDLERSPISRLVEAAMAIKHAAAAQIPLVPPRQPRSRLLLRGHPDRRHECRPRCRHDQCLRVRRRPGRPQPDRLRRHGPARPDAPPPRGRDRRSRAAFAASPAASSSAGCCPRPGPARIRPWWSRSPARPSSPARRCSDASRRTLWAAGSCCGGEARNPGAWAAVAPPQPERSMIPATPPSPPTEIPPPPGPELPPQPPVELPGLPDEPIIPPPAPDTCPHRRPTTSRRPVANRLRPRADRTRSPQSRTSSSVRVLLPVSRISNSGARSPSVVARTMVVAPLT